jgi:putative endonuclease
MISQRKREGWLGEVLAARYYRDHGYRILDANFRMPVGELDVIAYKDDTLIFCEVKTYRFSEKRYIGDAVDEHKRRRMVVTAVLYQQMIGFEGKVRFDVAQVNVQAPEGNQVTLIENAFELN